ncbi:hypothetical protein F5050DRAFT_1812698 [Lentinula boryana]|uniref:Ribonuclease H1 N-terminal domain-containing protein n=1 Tax=Lentinula boryana TaxID=40481 RepID=A0ABQ8PYG4_9AGAR|nr:hypothetical protein F5050DRAFT_1812698 [Lentinula boryana]
MYSDDGNSDRALSPSTVSSISSVDASMTEEFHNWSMATTLTCRPSLYESSDPLFDHGQCGKYPFYNVYVGDSPGCYKDWADASGRVTNMKGSRHKGYKSWAKALQGWQQNCRAYHHHPPGFVDGTLYSPSRRPEGPPQITPPPSHHNVQHFEVRASTPPTPQTPMNRTTTESEPSINRTPAELRPPMGRTVNHRCWAIHSPDFIGVVSSTEQAQNILDEAGAQAKHVTLRLVNDLSEAEEWLRLIAS